MDMDINFHFFNPYFFGMDFSVSKNRTEKIEENNTEGGD
jgi:hypothetical protein